VGRPAPLAPPRERGRGHVEDRPKGTSAGSCPRGVREPIRNHEFRSARSVFTHSGAVYIPTGTYQFRCSPHPLPVGSVPRPAHMRSGIRREQLCHLHLAPRPEFPRVPARPALVVPPAAARRTAGRVVAAAAGGVVVMVMVVPARAPRVQGAAGVARPPARPRRNTRRTGAPPPVPRTTGPRPGGRRDGRDHHERDTPTDDQSHQEGHAAHLTFPCSPEARRSVV
jgi:hypothetical protein